MTTHKHCKILAQDGIKWWYWNICLLWRNLKYVSCLAQSFPLHPFLRKWALSSMPVMTLDRVLSLHPWPFCLLHDTVSRFSRTPSLILSFLLTGRSRCYPRNKGRYSRWMRQSWWSHQCRPLRSRARRRCKRTVCKCWGRQSLCQDYGWTLFLGSETRGLHCRR